MEKLTVIGTLRIVIDSQSITINSISCYALTGNCNCARKCYDPTSWRQDLFRTMCPLVKLLEMK